jgi:hypothetical protein
MSDITPDFSIAEVALDTYRVLPRDPIAAALQGLSMLAHDDVEPISDCLNLRE